MKDDIFLQIDINTGHTKYFERDSKFNLKLSLIIIYFTEETFLNKNGLYLLLIMKDGKTIFFKDFRHQKIIYYVGN
jgi:hypothetical protein